VKLNYKRDYVILLEEERNLDKVDEEVDLNETVICAETKDCGVCKNLDCNAYWQINDNKYLEEVELREYYSKRKR
jgi:hypothetical protein